MRADDAVALARRRFESLSMQDWDPPVAAPDQPVTLQRPQDNGHGGTLHAEHHREEFLLSTSGPFRISLVTENTPPFGK
jgi:hypothetical protein